ncbi:MAG: phosphoribosylformylglycinamidine synthase subunit PurS [Euryarchaeota archaeon]|jgi:phosphoribosylformylglycinamidine synthase PurS subunit|nr:phosphoribosylformylglycinamidine synthase subunit PurS [Euryarchaeota archaeon]
MKYQAEVRISLKKGMLNPEASTIQRALALLNYHVEDTKTAETVTFSLEAKSPENAREEVDQMCQRLLCNPIIHDYQITVIPGDE